MFLCGWFFGVSRRLFGGNLLGTVSEMANRSRRVPVLAGALAVLAGTLTPAGAHSGDHGSVRSVSVDCSFHIAVCDVEWTGPGAHQATIEWSIYGIDDGVVIPIHEHHAVLRGRCMSWISWYSVTVRVTYPGSGSDRIQTASDVSPCLCRL